MELSHYGEILNKHGIKWNSSAMEAADISVLDGQVVMALLVGAVRADRFCEGALLDFLNDGSIKKWLMRLQEIDSNDLKA